MKKSTKVIATVIAVTLVITAMLVAIYAATAGNANISANVSWTAQAGVNLEFWAKATGGDESKEIAKTTITPTTTNTDANIIGDLSCNFTDTTDDGVNNPNAIKFTYYVRNKSLTPLNIKVTKTPAEAEESGTGAENHKPKVTLNSETDGTSTLTAVSSNTGYDLKAGDIFTYSVTLSLAKGGTGTINADFGLAPNFDAGVTFNFNVGGDNNGTIVTSVDGATPTTVSSSTLAGQTLGEYLATQQTAKYSTGWFFDEGLTKVVSDDYLSQDLKDSSLMSPIYCKTASITGLVFTLSDDGNSYLVSGEAYNTPAGDVVIPNSYNGKPVVGLAGTIQVDQYGYGAFTGNLITNIVLPNSITEIRPYAFQGCSGLMSITLPSGITRIRDRAFGSCKSLKSIFLPKNVTYLGNTLFYNCEILKSILIPSSVTTLNGNPFSYCVNLVEIVVEDGNEIFDSRDNCNAIIETASNELSVGCKNTSIPNTVTEICGSAFEGCSSLTSIEIPNSVTHIGRSAFEGCSSLTGTLTIPDNVTSIGRSAFEGCSSLTSIEIPNSVTSIGIQAFSNCSGLTNVTIGNSVTSIGEYAFNGCSGLTSVNIGNSVTSIGNRAFDGCSGLLKIFIPASVTTISASSVRLSPFRSCSSTLKIYCEASEKPSGWETKWNYYDSSNQLNVTWGVTRAQFDAL